MSDELIHPSISQQHSSFVAANHVWQAGEWVKWDGAITLGDTLGNYKASDIPTTAEASDDTKYYGYIDTDGLWYIMRTVDSTGTIRFTKGTSGYTTAWTGKTGHSYGYYDAIF